jgi:hypothetical protein
MERSFAELCTRLTRVGLDLVGSATVSAYDAIAPASMAIGPHVPGARSAIVIGNGGGALWEAFRGARRSGAAHPLDEWTRDVVTDAVGPLAVGARLLWPFVDATPRVSFVHLAICAGLGRPSLTGVLVHPEYGPWIALRAAVVVPFELGAPRPADGFDPCPGCVERPCIAACPGAAVGEAGFAPARCAGQRLAAEPDTCAAGCHARIACVLGRAHRYPDDAQGFHQAAARAAMAADLRLASGSAQRRSGTSLR